jgi:seryl-tRNA synthetase
MLDIRYIRENPDRVAEFSKQKGYDIDVSTLLQLDEQRRDLGKRRIRFEQNEIVLRTR